MARRTERSPFEGAEATRITKETEGSPFDGAEQMLDGGQQVLDGGQQVLDGGKTLGCNEETKRSQC